MIQKYIENANFEDTGFYYTLSLISGKHKMVILYCLMEFQVVRFNELKRYLKNISDKTLSANLKELEADGLIIRTEYPQIPPKVEYSLSGRGKRHSHKAALYSHNNVSLRYQVFWAPSLRRAPKKQYIIILCDFRSCRPYRKSDGNCRFLF